MWQIERNGENHKVYSCVIPCVSFDILQEALVGFELLFNHSCPLTALSLKEKWGGDGQDGLPGYILLI